MAVDLDRAIVRQSGVIPFRVRRGEMQIALITAAGGKRWTIPKGHIQPGLTERESAAEEAFEEAGLSGAVSHRSVGKYEYQKRGRMLRVTVFSLQVHTQHRRWPEMLRRKRRWLSAQNAIALLENPGLQRCVQQFARTMSQRADAIHPPHITVSSS